MKVKQDKCLNCGASINYEKIEKGVYQCPYCREYYHIDEYGLIEEYKVKLKYMGRIIHCYLGSVQYEPTMLDTTYIDCSGKMKRVESEPNITFELISYKIEDEENKYE